MTAAFATIYSVAGAASLLVSRDVMQLVFDCGCVAVASLGVAIALRNFYSERQ